jgi:nicotinate dehydrogenase subunit A
MSEEYDLFINGEPVHVVGLGTNPLLAVLRDELRLRGSRFGCGTEECGACMVLIDGEPSFSCTRAIETLAGKTVTTVEGLSRDGVLSPLQQAFLDEQAGQCGYCLSGILISATALLATNPRPTRSEIAAALDRHLCRCGVHNRIMRAVARAALASEASGQRGNSMVRAPDTRPEPGSSARAAAASGAQP